MNKFGHELSNGAKLTVSDGSVWHVALTRKGKDIWFHCGWEDFVESYSISARYFLMFRYEKNSNFNVIIFNLNACVGEESMNDEQNSDPKDEKRVEHVEQQSRKRKMEEVVEMDEPNSDNNFNLSVMLKKMGINVTHKHRWFSAESKRAISFARIAQPKNSSFVVILELHFKSCCDVYCPIKFAEKIVKKDSKFVKVQISNEIEESIELGGKLKGSFF